VIRATFDVNVLVSGFASSSGAPAALLERWLRRRFALVLSEHILMGVADVWSRPYWRARYEPAEAQRALALLRSRATLVLPAATVRGVAADEEDDLVLSTAVAGDVEFLVSGDKHLQGISRYLGVTILSPRRFLEFLELETRRGK
jgi:putative PIN family toxin of toxin-antitoxin system